jgi:sphingolipid delta-4 desaturase
MTTKFDERFPTYAGTWKRSIPGIHKDIAIDELLDEPHVKRRMNILEKYPQVKELFGVDARTIPISFASTFFQLALAYYFGKVSESMMSLLVTAYFVGGSMTQLFGVLIHEAAHCLIHTSPLVNRMIGLVANICIPFPIAQSFRRYHLEHHAFQGVEGKDPDLPLKWEIHAVKGNSFKKLLFLFFYPLMYVVRGLAMQKVIFIVTK